jgi:ariadne-1
MHYFTRYQTHNQSLELEKQLLEKVDDRIREMEENHVSYADRQAFPEACRVLQQCRQTLKYTYAFAYYLERNNDAEIFEQNQADLERATEVLSGFLENEFEVGQDIPRKLKDTLRYCDHRRAILIQHCKDGYRDNTWKGLDRQD